MSFNLELEGRRALVTGGTKGLGEAVVSVLLAAGVRVLTTARSIPEASSGGAYFVAADLRQLTVAPPLRRRSRNDLAESILSLTCSAGRARQAAVSRRSMTMSGRMHWIRI